MFSFFFCTMDIPIIDGKNAHRKMLADHQAESYAAASEILIGLSKQIAEMGFEIVPVTINDGGIPRSALSLAPMNLEQYIAFSKSIHAQPKAETLPTEEKGSGVSE
jgi:hypothetical protein